MSLDDREQVTAAIVEYLEARRMNEVVDIDRIVKFHIAHPDRSVRREGQRRARRILLGLAADLRGTARRGYSVPATIDDALNQMRTDVEAWRALRDALPA